MATNLQSPKDAVRAGAQTPLRELGLKRDAQSFEIFSEILADESLRRWECLFRVSVYQVSYL